MRIELFDQTRKFIEGQLATLTAPCVACSFGKDSMVMLHFVREQMPDIPVVYFEHMEVPSKHAFARQMAEELDLNLRVIPASKRDFYGREGHVEILEFYELAPHKFMICPVEPMSELDFKQPIFCGMEMLAEPIYVEDVPNFDGVFIGHRADDQDKLLGAVPIYRDTYELNGFRYVYPLRHWTAKDIWDAVRRYGIRVNGDRYGKQMAEANNDVWNLCTRCLANAGDVYCPKEEDYIPGMAQMVDLPERTRGWLQWTVNLKEKQL